MGVHGVVRWRVNVGRGGKWTGGGRLAEGREWRVRLVALLTAAKMGVQLPSGTPITVSKCRSKHGDCDATNVRR